MKQVILTKGLPASGKTTWATLMVKDHPGQYKRINKDDLRSMLDVGKWSKANEKFVLQIRDRLILEGLTAGYSLIVDDTNLNPTHEEHVRQLVKGQAEVVIQDFTDVSVEECIRRDQKRPNYVGEQVIRQMYNRYLRVEPPKIAPIPGLPEAIICDLDGTLALLNGRDPYDASTCINDDVNPRIQYLLDLAASDGKCILLVSGRQDKWRDQTEAWLERHEILYDELWMRKTDDNRNDTIIKHEIWEAEIKGKYNVSFVLDDRNQVVDLWRSLGLTCLQVAEGDF